MAKTVMPYRQGARGEVFVRMLATGSLHGRLARDAPYMIDVIGHVHDLRDGPVMHGSVRECDVVAMVVDDARYAWVDAPPVMTPTARGTSATFETPEAAAQMLEGLGWRVEPPPAGRRAGVRYWNPAAVGAHGEIADAHAEPIGEPRYHAQPTTSRPSSPFLTEWWVIDRHAFPARVAGPFDHEHLAQAEADDLNAGETK
jgi:hypothetical protein